LKSVIFKTATNYLLPLLLLFSVFVLLRGHYEPGGGFVGGLIASIAFVLHYLAKGGEKTKEFLKIHPAGFIPLGLFLSVTSGIIPLFQDRPFMTGLWIQDPVPVIGMVGTALFFDIGVYFVVIGVSLTILFTVAEDE
jgi:multicomponent Na+:H+ antiporter subunit B